MPDPLVVQLANEFRQRLIARDAAVTQEMASRWLAVEQHLFADMLDLAEKMAVERDAGRSISMSKLLRFERYQRLLLQVQEQLTRFNTATDARIIRASLESVLQGFDDAFNLVDATVRPFGGQAVDIVFDRLGAAAAENVAAIAREGQPLNQILQRSYPLAVQGITDRLIDGTARGVNPREVARRMRNEGLSQGLNHLLLVARDQQNRAYREAGRQQYQRSNVVEGYQRLAAKQPGRTCLACIALDGTIYETSELMEVHPQDRCSMVPIVTGFPRVRFPAGEQYFRSLPAEVQKKWMGEERYQLWKDGRFKFKQMAKIVDNDTWGPSTQVRPLSSLRQQRRKTPLSPEQLEEMIVRDVDAG